MGSPALVCGDGIGTHLSSAGQDSGQRRLGACDMPRTGSAIRAPSRRRRPGKPGNPQSPPKNSAHTHLPPLHGLPVEVIHDHPHGQVLADVHIQSQLLAVPLLTWAGGGPLGTLAGPAPRGLAAGQLGKAATRSAIPPRPRGRRSWRRLHASSGIQGASLPARGRPAGSPRPRSSLYRKNKKPPPPARHGRRRRCRRWRGWPEHGRPPSG